MPGTRTRECERECERVCVHARVCLARLGTGRNRSWICHEPETELPANRRRGAAANSRGRSLPGWGEDTTRGEFEGDQRKGINAIGAVGERELGTLFPEVAGCSGRL